MNIQMKRRYFHGFYIIFVVINVFNTIFLEKQQGKSMVFFIYSCAKPWNFEGISIL
jgi:hypothetical protein